MYARGLEQMEFVAYRYVMRLHVLRGVCKHLQLSGGILLSILAFSSAKEHLHSVDWEYRYFQRLYSTNLLMVIAKRCFIVHAYNTIFAL